MILNLELLHLSFKFAARWLPSTELEVAAWETPVVVLLLVRL